MATNTNYIGVAMGLDVTDLKAGISEANKQIKLANSEFKAASSGMEDWQKSTEGLNAKIKQLDTVLSAQKSKLAGLKAEYEKVAREQGENSEAARNLKIQINNQQAIVNRTEREFENFKDTLKQVEEGSLDLEGATLKAGKAVETAGEDAKESGEGFSTAKVAVANFIADGLTALVGAAKDAVVSLFNLAQETREFRQDMSTLETAFSEASFSAETATDTWKGLYAVFGEDDRAVEAANNIARMAKNEQELNEWVTITTGVWGTYQDALPVEALAESAGETAKVGTVTGNLADALNWSSEAAAMFADYMGGDVVTAEDAFNVALSECSTEAERQALITDTLTKLYGGAADTYRDTAGALMEANEATANNTLAQAEAGATLEPLTTMWTNFKTAILNGALPALNELSTGLQEAFGLLQSGDMSGAAESLADSFASGLQSILVKIREVFPVVIQTVGSLIGELGPVISAELPKILEMLVGTISDLANQLAVIAPTLIPDLISAILNALLAVAQNADELFSAATALISGLAHGILNALPILVQMLPQIVEAILTALLSGEASLLNMITFDLLPAIISTLISLIPQLIVAVVQIVVELFQAIISQVKNHLTLIFDVLKSIYSWAYENIGVPVGKLISDLLEKIKNGVQAAWDWIVGILSSVASWIDENVVQPIKDVFSKIANWFNDNVIQPIWNFIYPFIHNAKVLITGTWEIIQALFAVAAAWFDEKVIQPIAKFFTGLWNNISSWASDAWLKIKEIFQVVSSWFNKNIIQPVQNFFSGMWDKLKQGASDAWSGIKSVFSKVSSWFKDTFADAWAKVKGVFSTGGKVFDGIKDGIVSAFKTVVNAIIRGLNKVIAVPFNAINGILGKIKNVEVAGISPFSGLISNISVPKIPELEWGGILKKGQVGLLEGKGKEAIIPLERHLGWIRNIARELARYLASDTESIASGFVSSHQSRGGHNATRGGTTIDARMTVNYNGNLSRKELKRLENDNYAAIRTRLKAEGAI